MEAKPSDIVDHHQEGGNNEKEDAQLQSIRAEIHEVREDNERLKTVLARVVKDYQSLQVHISQISQQEQANKSPVDNPLDVYEEPEQIVLSLGASSLKEIKKEKKDKKLADGDQMRGDLSLGFGREVGKYSSNFVDDEKLHPASSNSSFEHEAKEEEALHAWLPSKMRKNLRSKDDEVAPENHHVIKRTRVAVRTRCDTPTMNDGCQWRKYGQKVSKGNPCPRAYYRCTVSPGCPVRKQVQRCVEDMSILITTYEGTHNHQLPVSATAMASTTSAAASMLTSGATASTSSTNLQTLNNLHPNSHLYIRNQLISPSSSHPTITLDLTSNNPTAPSYYSPATSSTSTTFSFASNQYMYPLTSQSHYWQQRAGANTQRSNHNQTDTIARAISTDPSFQSVLAAAITSYVEARRAAAQGGGPMVMMSPEVTESETGGGEMKQNE